MAIFRSSNTAIVFTFALLISAGTLLLQIPMATHQKIGLGEALFTAVSAVTVTGLSVVDVSTTFSFFGQIILLVLIQCGGLGIMTLASWVFYGFTQQADVAVNTYIGDQYGRVKQVRPRRFLFRVVRYTLIIESCGAAALFFRFQDQFSLKEALWQSIFHSISAFCNAGFSLFSNSLVGFGNDWYVNIVICALILLGGLGFLVMSEMWESARTGKRLIMMSLHSRIVVRTSLFLVVFGTVLFYLFERNGVLSAASGGPSFWGAFFLSVTARTAGFTTIDMSQLTNLSMLLLVALMIVGANPGSTGGGIKTTVIVTLFLMLRARLRNREQVHVLGRSLGTSTVNRALAAIVAYVLTLVVALFLIQYFEYGTMARTQLHNADFLGQLFEVVSALSTVGLSSGALPDFSFPSLVVITVCMFIGRIGPLFAAVVIAGSRDRRNYQYPEEELMVG